MEYGAGRRRRALRRLRYDALRTGVLTPNEWLDLGGLSSLSAEEYFGASLWQLYKSIDSPYKAVLKTLLLEAYSQEYPNPRLLAKDIKQRLHDGEIVSLVSIRTA